MKGKSIDGVLAASQENEWVLDPFTGSSTTGIACSLLGRRFLGIDREKEFLDLSIKRYQECQHNPLELIRRIPDLQKMNAFRSSVCESTAPYGEAPF